MTSFDLEVGTCWYLVFDVSAHMLHACHVQFHDICENNYIL